MKTQVCRHFMKGYCELGDSCGFAHGEHELGQEAEAPSVTPGSAPGGGGGGFLKTKICHHFLQGYCPREEGSCTFAHGEHELGTPQGGALVNDASMQMLQGLGQEEISDEMLLQHLLQEPSGGGSMGRAQAGCGGCGKGQGKVFMKSKLCTNHQQGWCTRGEMCTFAHGEHELGTPQPTTGAQSPALIKPVQKPWQQSAWNQADDEFAQVQPAAAWSPAGKGGVKGAVKAAPKVVSPLGSPWGNGRAGPAAAVAQPWSPAAAVAQPWSSAQPAVGKGGLQSSAAAGPPRFKKTRLCNHFLQGGACIRGASCTFAHGEEELGTFQPVVASNGAVASQPWTQPQQVMGGCIKTKICRHWERLGSCQLGESCGFAHGEDELGTTAPLNAGAGAAGGFQQAGGKGGGPTPAEKELYNFKTTMCNNFTNTGACQRGEKCSFAHGEDELMAPGQAKQIMEKMEAAGGDLESMDSLIDGLESFTGY